jgi:hypothetical protein
MNQKNCTYCNRKGLLIYPVRYAVACPVGAAGVPGLSGNFKIADAPQDIGTVKYTLRAPRPGYLYTYDENRRLLKAYIVMSRGHLWNFPIETPAPDVRHPMSCLDHVEVTKSFCVDVSYSDKEPAGIFWIGWSNSSWTPELIKLAGDAGWRTKHMQAIDVKAMMAGAAPHTGEFKSTHKNVSHFAADVRAMQKAFGFSNTSITHETRRRRWASEMIAAFDAHSPTHRGYIVAVNDPVGITNDLSELTVPTDSSGFDENVYRGKIINDLLNETERAVRENAKAKFAEEHQALPFKKSVAYSSNYRSFGERIRDVAVGDSRSEKRYELQQKRFEAARQQNQQAAMDNAWKELTTTDEAPLLDESRRKALPAEYERALKVFEPKASKLAKVHLHWLTSVQLANWMEGIHDSTNIASGFAFRESFAQCVGKAAATVACQAQLTEWLNSPNTADTRNLYMRAMLFNHTDIANAAQASIGGGDIKLEHVFSIYQGALDRLKNGDDAKLVDHLVLTTTNILVKALTHSGKAVMKNAAIVSLSLLGRTTISPSNLSPRDLRDWAIAQAKQQGIKLSGDRGQIRAEGLKEAKKVVPRVSPDAAICVYELDVAKLEQEGRIAPGTIKAVRIPGFDLTKKWFGSSQELRLAHVAAVLQIVALYFAISEYKSSDRFDLAMAGSSAIAASVSLTAMTVEALATAVEKTPTHPLSVYLYEHWSFGPGLAKKIIPVAKKVTLIAGLCAAFLDFVSGISALMKGEIVLGTLYVTSAALGVVLTVAAYIGAIFFWPTFIAAIAVAIALSFYKKTLLQKWIMRCFYAKGEQGRPPKESYGSLEEELMAYNNALGGA